MRKNDSDLGHLRVSRLLALMAVALLAACSTSAPRYQPSIDNVEVLKRTSGQVGVGTFVVKAGMSNATSIGLRASSMISPVAPDYAAYLADALRQELQLAGKLDPNSGIEISGALVRNEVNAGGLSTNDATIAAQFVVKKAGTVRYDKVKEASATWESSFVGAVAIPRAQQQYPVVVQKLLATLVADTDFQAALK